MDQEKYNELWQYLTADLHGTEDITSYRPLLAHYTSMSVIEQVFKNEEFWMSNPLNMNDLQELRAGIHMALSEVPKTAALRTAFRSDERFDEFQSCFSQCVASYGENDAFDLYVGCFSEHDAGDTDGKLAMWRGYGDYGNGAAFIIDTSKIEVEENNALILAPVRYATDKERSEYVRKKTGELAEFVASRGVTNDEIYALAHYFFQRILLFSVFSKHNGFSEEREWRLAYLKDRDVSRRYTNMFSYFNGPRGLEPKLKLKLGGPDGVLGDDPRYSDVFSSIIIGPRASSPLSVFAAQRMFRDLNRDGIANRIVGSSIPFRG